MSLLDTFTPLGWAKLAGAVAVAGLLTASYVGMRIEIQKQTTGWANERAGRMQDRLDVAERDRKALAERVAERTRIDVERKKVDDETEQKLNLARADAVTAGAAADRLRGRYAALVAASGRAPDAATAVAGGAPASPADLPTDVLGRVLDVARQYVDAAELAIIRGERCAGEYDALTSAPISLGVLKLGG